MGQLFYGAETQPAVIPDHVLAHVKVVATTKLRRGECFTLSWKHPDGVPGGRTAIWIQPAIPLKFVFDSAEPEQIDPSYLQELSQAASRNGGIVIEWQETPDCVPADLTPAEAPRHISAVAA